MRTKRKLYYSVVEVAKILKQTRQEVVRKIWRGQIKAKKLAGRYVIHCSQIEKLTDKRR